MESQRIDVRSDEGWRAVGRGGGGLDENTVQQAPFVLSRPLGCAIFSQIQELRARSVDSSARRDARPAFCQAFISPVQEGTMGGAVPKKKLAFPSRIMRLVNNYGGLPPEAG